jgi:hypothetical protein
MTFDHEYCGGDGGKGGDGSYGGATGVLTILGDSGIPPSPTGSQAREEARAPLVRGFGPGNRGEPGLNTTVEQDTPPTTTVKLDSNYCCLAGT